MSDTHSSEDPGLIKTPTQLIVVVVLAFVLPIAAIFTIIHFVMGDNKSRASPGMSDKAVAERIKPVGSVPEIENSPSPLVAAPTPVVVTAAPAGNAAAAPVTNGKAVYDAGCQACHGAGVAGAPKLGDKAAAGYAKAALTQMYGPALVARIRDDQTKATHWGQRIIYEGREI